MTLSKNAEKRRAELLANPGDKAHGTKWGYELGCRCERCVEAKREYTREANKRYREKMKSLRAIRAAQAERDKAARRAAIEPNPEPPKPNPVRVAKHEAAVKAKAAKAKKPPLFTEQEKQLMRGPSIAFDPPRCAVCGRTWPVEKHHVVKRSQGGTDGPTIMLCGQGNNLRDANGRYYCHGRAEHRMLHFRWVPSEYFAEGHWEYLVTKVPMKYQLALTLGGWKELKGGE